MSLAGNLEVEDATALADLERWSLLSVLLLSTVSSVVGLSSLSFIAAVGWKCDIDRFIVCVIWIARLMIVK